MLLALTGKMPEALLAMSNAVDLAKSKPTDDPLALARAHDAIGRTLIEMKQTVAGVASLKLALKEFGRHEKAHKSEVLSLKDLLNRLGN